MKNDLVLFYVDDDEDDLMFFGEAANELGFEVRLFDSGEKLLLALQDPDVEPSIIFVDLNMPGKSGYEVIAEVRASSRWNDLTSIVLSTASDSYSIEKSRAAGASMFMQKPPNLDKLVLAISGATARDWSVPAANLDFVYIDS